MQEHVKVAISLSLYGIFKEFRPSELYMLPYLTSPPHNFTYEQITEEIYPVSTYSTILLLIVVFLVTDFCRYKIVIILQAASHVTIYVMLIFSRGLFQMEMTQLVYGIESAADVAYFTYPYAKVDTSQFQKVTSYTRSAHLMGKSLSGVVAQIGVLFDHSYLSLFWINVVTSAVSLVFACMIPSVDRSMYFHRHSTKDDTDNNITTSKGERQDCSVVASFLWSDLRAAFTNSYVLKWTTWYVLSGGGYYMFISYVQLLWATVRVESDNKGLQLNGVVETSYTLLGSIGSLAIGRVTWDWCKLGDPVLTLSSFAMAGLLYIMSASYSVYVAYIAYVLCTTIFQVMITVAWSEMAKNVNRESYALVFGIASFVCNIVQCLFNFIMLQVFEAGIKMQFQVYAVYFIVLGLCYGISLLWNNPIICKI